MRSKQNFARMAEVARPDGHQDRTQRRVDLDAAERAAADLLAALGIDLDREERRATPGRMARAYAESAPGPRDHDNADFWVAGCRVKRGEERCLERVGPCVQFCGPVEHECSYIPASEMSMISSGMSTMER